MQRAGERLNVSHAAISQQLRALEAHMGVALLDRSARRLTLTAEGRQLAAALAAGFGAIARSVEDLSGQGARRPVQVSTTPGFAAYWLMPRMLDFRHRHPDIDVMILPTPDLVILEPGGIDVAIRHGMGSWAGVAAERFLPTRLVVVGAPRLVGERAIGGPAELAALPWLQEYGNSESTDWLARKGLATIRVGAVTKVPGSLMLEGVRQGQGVALLTRQWVEDDLACGRLRLLFEEPGETAYYIVTRPGEVLRPPVRAFLAWLRRQAGEAQARQ
ncbi:MAG: LysR substrate-binding domain-containing protein [Roseovarius sp.]